MKLVNPTDDQIDAAFAEKVAGWSTEEVATVIRKRALAIQDGANPGAHAWRFTQSADAVLPFVKAQNAKEKWAVEIFCGDGRWCVYFKSASAEADTFAKAAAIALLRAHGVEVEFTT